MRTAWTQPLSLLHVIDVPAQFHNRDRERLTRYGKWAEFQMLKADVLRRALSAGHASALYLDCDVLLLAPLPPMGAAPLGLSRRRVNAADAAAFGRYSGGAVFVREASVLDAWARASSLASKNASLESCCRDQLALDAVALEVQHFELDRNFHVGWYDLDRAHSHDGRDHIHEIGCADGALVYGGGPMLSVHLNLKKDAAALPEIRAKLAACSDAIPMALRPALGLDVVHRGGASAAAQIAVLTYSDRSASLRPVVELNRWYCHRHGYDLVMRSAPTHPALHPSWQKIQLVLDYAPRYTAVLFMDDDAIFVKLNVRIETFLHRFPADRSDLIAAVHDCPAYGRKPACRRHLNLGVWIARPTAWLTDFLSRQLSDLRCELARESQTCCWEQDCTESVLGADERTAHVGEMPMGEFACQPLHRSYNGTCDPFIFHALGQNTKQQLLGKARATLAAATSMQPPPPPPMLALPAGLNTAQVAGTHGRALVL